MVFIPPWTNHPLSQLVQWCEMIDAVLPIRWACPRTPAPAPTGPLHTGQSDFHPEQHTLKRFFRNQYLNPARFVGELENIVTDQKERDIKEKKRQFHDSMIIKKMETRDNNLNQHWLSSTLEALSSNQITC